MREVLSRIERENEKANYWIVGPETGRMLWWLVRVVCPERALEIGTSVGYSAIWMGAALDGGKLWTVESHAERHEKARGNIAEAGLGDKVVQVKGHAPEVLDEVPEELDFVFFDATKEEHEAYFDVVFPRMRAGGMIVVDNVKSHRGEMAGFLERLRAEDGLSAVELGVGSGLLVGRVYRQ